MKALVRWLEDRLRVEEERPLPLWLRTGLGGLALLYRGLYHVARAPYRYGLLRPVHPGVPVISVGNLAVGGTGKTPCVIWLANALRRKGFFPVVLAHGYKGRSRDAVVVAEGKGGFPSPVAGDEATLVALACPGVPVVAGRDRVAAAALAVEKFAPEVLLADDAFQHWALARDLDLVLLDAEKPFGNGRLLPRGWLREPVEALRRANGLILVGEGKPPALAWTGRPLFRARILPVTLTPWERWRQGHRDPLGQRREKVDVLCGIARPARFLASLIAVGLVPVERLIVGDHEQPTPEELRSWAAKSRRPVVMTEKDAVKFTPSMAAILKEKGRGAWVLGVVFCPEDEEILLGFAVEAINRARERPGGDGLR
ncbi:MAG: tetraacyldisaccharide 4'-kinase [Firmicutes bacterium]|nr:tetraacyldisaccharide 4'-kinase [Bacillota bacterium]